MNFGTKRNKPPKKKQPPREGIVNRLQKRNAALELQIKKLRGN